MVPAVHLHERGHRAAVAVLELVLLQGQERQAEDPDQLRQQPVSIRMAGGYQGLTYAEPETTNTKFSSGPGTKILILGV